jgi:hypothetical protein
MATIEQYQSGEAAKAVKNAIESMQTQTKPLAESGLGKILKAATDELKPIKIDQKQAEEHIRQATTIAVGKRVCMWVYEDDPPTRSVFLDDLAQGMVDAGKAEFASTDEALQVLAEQKGHPIIISRVSGHYAEICRTYPEHCLYWNMEKHGLKCIQRD